MNLIQTLLEIFRFRSIWQNNEGCIMDCIKTKIFRNDKFSLQILQIVYSHLMKQGKNSCCLSGSEFTSLELNLVTVFSRRCFSFLSNVLSFFLAIKKKEYLVRGLGLHKPQYKTSNWQIPYQVRNDEKCHLEQSERSHTNNFIL